MTNSRSSAPTTAASAVNRASISRSRGCPAASRTLALSPAVTLGASPAGAASAGTRSRNTSSAATAPSAAHTPNTPATPPDQISTPVSAPAAAIPAASTQAHHHVGRGQLVRGGRQRRDQRDWAGRVAVTAVEATTAAAYAAIGTPPATAAAVARHPGGLHQVTPGQKNHRGPPVRQRGEHRRQQRRRHQLRQRHHAGDRGAAPAVGIHQHGDPHRILGQDEQRVPRHHPPQRPVARQRPEHTEAAAPSQG